MDKALPPRELAMGHIGYALARKGGQHKTEASPVLGRLPGCFVLNWLWASSSAKGSQWKLRQMRRLLRISISESARRAMAQCWASNAKAHPAARYSSNLAGDSERS